jgi:hypothetical protein
MPQKTDDGDITILFFLKSFFTYDYKNARRALGENLYIQIYPKFHVGSTDPMINLKKSRTKFFFRKVGLRKWDPKIIREQGILSI